MADCMIIPEIGNINPNFQIPYISLNEVQCFSQSAHQFSFYNVVECEVQSDYNFEFFSYVDPVSFSMKSNIYGTDLIKLTEWADFINFQAEFIPLCDFWITIIFDEVFIIDGKTHLDSVCEGVIKAILSALESFVKKVTELISKFLSWIYELINKMLKPAFSFIEGIFKKIANAFVNLLSPFITNMNEQQTGRSSNTNSLDVALAFGSIIGGLIVGILVMKTILICIGTIVDGFTGAGVGSIGLKMVAKSIIIAAIGVGLSFGEKSMEGEFKLDFSTICKGATTIFNIAFFILTFVTIMAEIYILMKVQKTRFVGQATALSGLANDIDDLLKSILGTFISLAGFYVTQFVTNQYTASFVRLFMDGVALVLTVDAALEFILPVSSEEQAMRVVKEVLPGAGWWYWLKNTMLIVDLVIVMIKTVVDAVVSMDQILGVH
jgi:hypothetical protein